MGHLGVTHTETQRQLLGTANGTRHIQHSPGTPTTGLCERGNDTSRSRSGRQNAAIRRNMRREERVTVQGPVKKQQPYEMSHRGLTQRPGALVCRSPGVKRPIRHSTENHKTTSRFKNLILLFFGYNAAQFYLSCCAFSKTLSLLEGHKRALRGFMSVTRLQCGPHQGMCAVSHPHARPPARPCIHQGMSGLLVREGGVNRAPKIWGGGGFGKRAELTGTIDHSL